MSERCRPCVPFFYVVAGPPGDVCLRIIFLCSWGPTPTRSHSRVRARSGRRRLPLLVGPHPHSLSLARSRSLGPRALAARLWVRRLSTQSTFCRRGFSRRAACGRLFLRRTAFAIGFELCGALDDLRKH